MSTNRLARRAASIALAAAAVLVALVADGVAQTGGRWAIVVPPPVPEKRALIRVYTAVTTAEVRAAVDSLPQDQQASLVTKVYKILTIPTTAERTEAMLEALQDPAAPVPSWRRVGGAFDSAASCERQRELALQTFELEASRVRSADTDPDELSVEDWRLLEGLSACRKSRCVPESSLLTR